MDNKETGDADYKSAPAKTDSAMTSDESTRQLSNVATYESKNVIHIRVV